MSEFVAKPLDQDQYLKFYSTLVDQYEVAFSRATELVVQEVQRIKEDNIKWLSIGAGNGHWEKSILTALKQSCPEKEVVLLDAYEPNPHTFQHLSKWVKQEGLWGPNPENYNLYQEAVGHHTKFPNEYNLITISHVLYYIPSKEDRQKLFISLQESLLSPGRIMILHAEKVLDGRASEFGQMVRTFLEMLKKGPEFGEPAPYLKANTKMTATDIHTGFLKVMKEGVQGEIIGIQSYLNMGRPSDPDDNEVTKDILSILLSCDVRKLLPEAYERMAKWIEDIGEKLEGGRCRIFHPNACLVYSMN